MLRKEEGRNRRSQARTVVLSPSWVPMTRGASLRSRVKGNFQARFWSSGGRGDSPTDCRKLSDGVKGTVGAGEVTLGGEGGKSTSALSPRIFSINVSSASMIIAKR